MPRGGAGLRFISGAKWGRDGEEGDMWYGRWRRGGGEGEGDNDGEGVEVTRGLGVYDLGGYGDGDDARSVLFRGKGFFFERCDFGSGAKVRLRVGCVDGRGVPGRREGGIKSNGEEGREADVEVEDGREEDRAGVDGRLGILTECSKSALSVGVMDLRYSDGVRSRHSPMGSCVGNCSGAGGRRPRHSRTRSCVLGTWRGSGVGGKGLSTSISGVKDLVEGRGLRRF